MLGCGDATRLLLLRLKRCDDCWRRWGGFWNGFSSISLPSLFLRWQGSEREAEGFCSATAPSEIDLGTWRHEIWIGKTFVIKTSSLGIWSHEYHSLVGERQPGWDETAFAFTSEWKWWWCWHLVFNFFVSVRISSTNDSLFFLQLADDLVSFAFERGSSESCVFLVAVLFRVFRTEFFIFQLVGDEIPWTCFCFSNWIWDCIRREKPHAGANAGLRCGWVNEWMAGRA